MKNSELPKPLSNETLFAIKQFKKIAKLEREIAKERELLSSYVDIIPQSERNEYIRQIS